MSIAARLLECNPTVVKRPWAAVSAAAEEPFRIAAAGETCIAAAGAVDPSVAAAVVVAVVAGVVVAVAGGVKSERGARS